MKPSNRYPLIFALLFLFLLHSIGTLVESIYILDLLKTSLDEKALGLLFLFSPLCFLFLKRKPPQLLIGSLFVLLFIARGITPFLLTGGRLLAGGIAAAAALLLFPLLFHTHIAGQRPSGQALALGLALAVAISVFLRTLGLGMDYTLQSAGGWLGWVFGLILGVALKDVAFAQLEDQPASFREALVPLLGVWLIFALVYFAFSAPSVMARWVESDYRLTVGLIGLLCLAGAGLVVGRLTWFRHLSQPLILLWNVLFTLALTGTLWLNRVVFPSSPDSAPLIVGTATRQQQVPFYLTLLLFPVLFVDLFLLTAEWQQKPPSLPALGAGMGLGVFLLILLVFMQIFTNVWGYVEPLSPWFRNKFWLPYFLMSAFLTLLISLRSRRLNAGTQAVAQGFSLGWLVLTGAFCGVSLWVAFATTQVRRFEPRPKSLLVMTYNLQQGNDSLGERSYSRQLALMKQVDADIIALQESDSARVSLNNADLVRYFSAQLGYYAYYGPGPISGSYGTAILSKYPLHNPRVVFSYSDQDEIGTAVAEIEVEGKKFTIYNVHPDGSDTAMMVFARTLLEQIGDQPYVIVLGDYNLREDEAPYQLLSANLTNVWESSPVRMVSPQGGEMAGGERIDHIFLSLPLRARWATYLLPPESATDHPVHWAEISWEE